MTNTLRMLPLIVGVAALSAAPRTASATEVGYSRDFGLGLMLGEPTGITGKYWLTEEQALDFGVGFGGYHYRHCDRWGCYGGYDGQSLNVDYLWHPAVLVPGKVELVWHIGAGGRIWFDGRNRYQNDRDGVLDVAVRMPVGLDMRFNKPDFLEIYAELTPSLYLFYGPDFGFDGGIGARFYF